MTTSSECVAEGGVVSVDDATSPTSHDDQLGTIEYGGVQVSSSGVAELLCIAHGRRTDGEASHRQLDGGGVTG